MGGILDEKSMDTKIRNAFYAIGNEESLPFPGLEFKAITVKFQDVPTNPPGTVIDWVPADLVAQTLNDGWQMGRHIICQPYVMFIFHRVKETKENEREQQTRTDNQ